MLHSKKNIIEQLDFKKKIFETIINNCEFLFEKL